MSDLPNSVVSICMSSPPAMPTSRLAFACHGIAIACAMLLTACMPTRPAPTGVEFVIVRHAEKSSDDPRDPTLSEAGLARAHRLAASLQKQPLAAAYATAYRRTQQTAAPAASDHGLTVTTYDAALDAKDLASTLKQRHASGTVLVVGHSNTVPAIAAALCACVVAPLRDDEFDRRLQVRIDASGHATLIDTRTP
jgi:phosphohistidine phosphatase SixA